ncbi:SusD/RagB family nutrient-binding outer membrane lipoprotein [Leyella stercorea]|uniref:SusD/RagB family nutrient-binding outer membrane lipoprotein n=1 Tax=Leyella stercorea TaxID=363265 RepID=UPI00266D4C17|nr:SusD/RagB family nutrient-binding outer membrane lipoprotein [Leyella stercorea]
MKKRNIFAVSSMLALAVMGSGMLSSCTDDFEDLNTNKTQVDPGDLPFAAQCAEAMNYCYAPHQNMFQFWTNLTIDLYGGYFQTPHGNFTNCDMGENRGHSGGMYENYYLHIFNNTRRNITNLEKQSKPGLAATMRIVQAVGTMQATDAYGPLAYSSIINAESETTYRFDSQQKLYEQMLDDLDKAIVDLKAMSDEEKVSLATYDTWGGGDPAIWVQIANTMKLRIALRLSKRESEMAADGYDLKAIATAAADNTLAVSGKDIVIKDQSNELKRMFEWLDCGMNANLVTLMVGMNDPRLPLYMTKNADDITNEKGVTTPKGSVYCGIRYASGMKQKGSDGWYGYKMSQWVGSYNTPLPIFKAAEAYFLLAEAKLRWNIGGTSVKDLYEQGIRLSIKNELAYKGSFAGIENISDADIDDYINGTTGQADYVDPGDSEHNCKAVNTLGVKWDDAASKEDQLARIQTQKYIALFPLSNEGWAEQRRTGYPKFFVALVNKSNGAVDTQEGVRRVIYSSNAYDTNAEGIKGGIELLDKENTSKKGISGDKGGTHLWWDNANKGNF